MLQSSAISMSRQSCISAAVCLALLLAGCGEPSQEDKNEELRKGIREKKRAEAAANYKLMTEKFQTHEHAAEAQRKIVELGAKK